MNPITLYVLGGFLFTVAISLFLYAAINVDAKILYFYSACLCILGIYCMGVGKRIRNEQKRRDRLW
jgi:hypothetical protein